MYINVSYVVSYGATLCIHTYAYRSLNTNRHSLAAVTVMGPCKDHTIDYTIYIYIYIYMVQYDILYVITHICV